MAEIKLTEQNFQTEVLEAPGVALVDFWATWCGPCRLLGPIVEEIAREYEGRVKVGKVNVDEENALAMRYGIASIPTLLVFRDGELVNNSIGLRAKEHITDMLDEALA